MSDPLDLEIAGEIEKISKDIKSILEKVETLYPKEQKKPEGGDENKVQEPQSD